MGDVEICNQALGWVGGNRITSLDTSVDESTEAKLCSDNYGPLRDVVLEEGAWNFAKRRYVLTPLVSTPAWGYAREFLIPPEVLRMLRVTDRGGNPDNGQGIHWHVKENKIETDAEILYCIATIRITDTTKFSAGMIQALSARIAMDLAIPLTRKSSVLRDMSALYDQKLSKAMSFENMQGTEEDLINRALIDSRFLGSGYVGIS